MTFRSTAFWLQFRAWTVFVVMAMASHLARAEAPRCVGGALAYAGVTTKIYRGPVSERQDVTCADDAQARQLAAVLDLLAQLKFDRRAAVPLFNQGLMPQAPLQHLADAFQDEPMLFWLGGDRCATAFAYGGSNGIVVCDSFYGQSPARQLATLIHEARHVHAARRLQAGTAKHVACARGRDACDLSLRQKGAYAASAEFLSKLALYAPTEELRNDARSSLASAKDWFVLDPYDEAAQDERRQDAYVNFGRAVFTDPGVWYHQVPNDVADSLFQLLSSSFSSSPYCSSRECSVGIIDLHCTAGKDEFDINCEAKNAHGPVRTKIPKLDLGRLMKLVQLVKTTDANVVAEMSLPLPFDLAAIGCSQSTDEDKSWAYRCRALKAATRPTTADSAMLEKFRRHDEYRHEQFRVERALRRFAADPCAGQGGDPSQVEQPRCAGVRKEMQQLAVQLGYEKLPAVEAAQRQAIVKAWTHDYLKEHPISEAAIQAEYQRSPQTTPLNEARPRIVAALQQAALDAYANQLSQTGTISVSGEELSDALLGAMAQYKIPDSPGLRDALRKDLVSRKALLLEAEQLGIPQRPDVRDAIDRGRRDIMITAMLADFIRAHPDALP
jgi:hypothetical protein